MSRVIVSIISKCSIITQSMPHLITPIKVTMHIISRNSLLRAPSSSKGSNTHCNQAYRSEYLG